MTTDAAMPERVSSSLPSSVAGEARGPGRFQDGNVTEHYDVIIVGTGAAHQAGTCQFGNDPATSVLDVNCKAHELDNLYVVDTSIFPSIGAVNPALTAMANAIRVGEHLLSRMS